MRIIAGIMFAAAICLGFGWFVSEDVARAVGLVAAGMLALVISTVPIGPVP